MALFVCAVLLLAGCGGGGTAGSPIGDGAESTTGDGAGVSIVDYGGATTQAAITTTNARALADAAYSGADTGSAFIGKGAAVGGADGETTRPIYVILSSTLLESMERADISGSAGTARAAVLDITTGEAGCNGGPGSAAIQIDLDPVSGQFLGEIHFQGFCSDMANITGVVGFSGSYNFSRQAYDSFTMAVPEVTISTVSTTFRSGGVIYYVDMGPYASVETTLVQENVFTGKTFKVEGLRMSLTGTGTETYLKIHEGRFYHHDYGYLDIFTPSPLHYYDTSPWPSTGALVLVGLSGSSIRLTATGSGQTYRVQADCDGDGIYEHDEGTGSWPATTSVAPANPSMLSLGWRYGVFGREIGGSGMSTFDLDGDGTLEIITSATGPLLSPDAFWYVVREVINGGYEIVWSSARDNSAITSILATDADGDGKGEVYVAHNDGTVLVHDGETYAEIASLSTGTSISSMAVADIDNDGTAEIVLSDGVKILVYSTFYFSKEWESEAYGGLDLAIGNVDDDAAPEIVIADWTGGYVVDGVSRALEWDFAEGFGLDVEVADVDNDGRDEIVGAARWNKITIFDGDLRTPAWEIATAHDIGGLLVGDVDGDGVKDIVYGDRQRGDLHYVDTSTRTEKWSLPVSGPMDSAISYGDVDSDGVNEVIWGVGGASTGHHSLAIADIFTGTIEWENVHVEGPLAAVDTGDIDDDGRDEIVMVSNKSDNDYMGRVLIFDAMTHVLEWSSTTSLSGFYDVRSVRVADVDDDGQTEFVVTSGSYTEGGIKVYNGTTHLLETSSAYYAGHHCVTLEIGDVDGDGQTEVVAGLRRVLGAYPGISIVVLDGATLVEEWRSEITDAGVVGATDIELKDIDGDGNIEIITAYGGRKVHVHDGVTHQLEWVGEVAARSVDTFDMASDGTMEILVGKTDGNVEVYRGPDYSFLATFALPLAEKIEALLVDDVDLNGTQELVVTSAGRLSIFDLQSLGLLWQSDNLGGNLGWYNQLISRDIDGDGRNEVFAGSDAAIYQFD